MNNEFAPKRGLAERYSIESMSKSRGLSVEEFKASILKEHNIKNELIQEHIDKGYTQEQAEATALMILYIPGFSARKFKD